MIAAVIVPRSAMALVGVAVLIRIVFFVGYANVDPWDDTIYLELARQTAADGDEAATPLPLDIATGFSARRGVVVPIVWAQWLLGVNEIASSLYSLLCALGTLLVTHRLASIFGRGVGLTAVALLAVLPLDVVFSTRITAEAAQVFWTAAMVLAVVELSRVDTGTALRPKTARFVRYVVFALSVFVTCWTRIAGLVLLPIAIAAAYPLWRERERRGDVVWLAAGGVTAFVLAGGWQIFAAERSLSAFMFELLPEARFELASFFVVHVAYAEGTVHQFLKETLGIVPGYPGVRLFGGWALYAVAGVAATLYCWLRGGEARLIAGWVVWGFGFFQYGFRGLAIDSGALQYFMVAPRPRHLTLVAVPLVIAVALALRDLASVRPRASRALMALILVSGLFGTYTSHGFYRRSMADVRALATFLKERDATVLGDAWLVHQLPLYGARAELGSNGPLPPGALVALGGSRGFDVPAAELAPWISPRAGWEEVFRRSGELHEGRGSDLVVYRVAP